MGATGLRPEPGQIINLENISENMACSAIYFLDNKGKVLISRNYRGDIENSAIDKFIGENSIEVVLVLS